MRIERGKRQARIFKWIKKMKKKRPEKNHLKFLGREKKSQNEIGNQKNGGKKIAKNDENRGRKEEKQGYLTR